MKWEPAALMLLLLGLAVWLVISDPGAPKDLRPGAATMKFQIAHEKGVLEVVRDPEISFRVILRNGWRSEVLDESAFAAAYGEAALREVKASGHNWVFALLNITSWGSLAWVCVGFGGQAAFTGRMAVQWLVSERQKQSVVPESFWWMSLFGGVMLFSYFVWRQDLVAVIGQTSGVVIYARNIRLIYKKRRREARAAAAAEDGGTGIGEDPAPAPTLEMGTGRAGSTAS